MKRYLFATAAVLFLAGAGARAETTLNVGMIEGGTAGNVVAERCRVEIEVRSLDDAKASDLAREVVDACTWAASATETDVDAHVEEHFRAYRIPESHPCVEVASGALRDCGIEPILHPSGGGSDASVFEDRGLRCLNVANGTEANHTSDESVTGTANVPSELTLPVAIVVHVASGFCC